MNRFLPGLLALFAAMFLAASPAPAQSADTGSGAGATQAGDGDLESILARQRDAAGAEDRVITTEDANSDLEAILARQRGEDVERIPRDFGNATGNAEEITGLLGVRGGASDAEVWEALRFGTADVTVSAGGDPARVLVQDRGMWWYRFRDEVVRPYGGWLLLGMIGLLALFFLVRGRIRISHGRSGQTITRFTGIERFAHWLLAGSFILLALTGLFNLYARRVLIDRDGAINDVEGILARQGNDIAAQIVFWSKWVHNNVSWAFMIALVLVFVFWVWHNLPSRTDLKWIAQGGGFIGSGHPPAKKFNFGQKIVFWSVIVLGASISASGLSLLFPFELPMFAKTFAILNDIGAPGWFGEPDLPERLAPHEEMQFAQLWHAIVSFVLMAIIIAHIYIGTIGMEGAYDAMGSGEVDLNWAKEHHSLWVEEKLAEDQRAAPEKPAQPAE